MIQIILSEIDLVAKFRECRPVQHRKLELVRKVLQSRD